MVFRMSDKNYTTIFERHVSRPFSAYLKSLQYKIQDINELLDSPAGYDQYPGRVVPTNYSRWYGPIDPVTPRRNGEVGYEGLADVADPAAFILPRNGNIKVGPQGTFVLHEVSFTGYLSVTYGVGGSPPATHRDFNTFGDIFDDVCVQNGGAEICNNFRFWRDEPISDANDGYPFICFDIALYDKLRGRQLHDGTRLPVYPFTGQNFANRAMSESVRFPPNTEIEPRIYLNAVGMGPFLDTTAVYNACSFKAYLNLTFKGHLEQKQEW